MGMDCSGSLALLAGRRHSALVQLHWDSHNTLGENQIFLLLLFEQGMNYTGSRIYGPPRDREKIDHIAEIQVQFWIYGQFLVYSGRLGPLKN